MAELMNLRVCNWGRALEEIEVAALVGLRDVPGVELPVSARVLGRSRRPGRAPGRELRVGHTERDPPGRNVELDDVAVPDERQRAADERLRRDVQHARPVTGAA